MLMGGIGPLPFVTKRCAANQDINIPLDDHAIHVSSKKRLKDSSPSTEEYKEGVMMGGTGPLPFVTERHRRAPCEQPTEQVSRDKGRGHY